MHVLLFCRSISANQHIGLLYQKMDPDAWELFKTYSDDRLGDLQDSDDEDVPIDCTCYDTKAMTLQPEDKEVSSLTSNIQTKDFIKQMQQWRKDEIMVDFTLVSCEGKSFCAHKVVLAVFSDYVKIGLCGK